MVRALAGTAPAIVTPFAASMRAVRAPGGSAVDAGLALGTPLSRVILVAEDDESPLLTHAAPHRGFPEVIRGLRWMPLGEFAPKTCETRQHLQAARWAETLGA